MQDASQVVVLVSNGPGELATWVRPLAEILHKRLAIRPREVNASISLKLVLVPCPNSTGNEADTARKWFQFEEIHNAKNFWNLLVRPNAFGRWPNDGVVVFLGGDQFWSVLLSARLGYRHLTYAEWLVRWPGWNDRIAAMTSEVRAKIPKRFKDRCTVVGDLMADLSISARDEAPLPSGEWVALMPGSKRSKLCVGVPFLLEVADHLALIRPNCRFLLPVAPTTNLEEIQKLVTPLNPISKNYSSGIHSIKPQLNNETWKRLVTHAGTEIYLEENQPSYYSLSQCDLALTTVGANTAELGALGIPMIVLVPTQHLKVMYAWDGLLGLLGRLPGFKWSLGKLVTLWRLRRKSFLAWPNISASRMVVPERVGKISPLSIAEEAADWLDSPERLKGQKEDLRSLRGQPGALNLLANEVLSLMPNKIIGDGL